MLVSTRSPLFFLALLSVCLLGNTVRASTLDYVESASAMIHEVRVGNEEGGGFESHVLSEPREVRLLPPSDDVADLLVDLGLAPGVYERVRLIVGGGTVVLTEDARVTDGHTFSDELGNLSFASGAQTGEKSTITPSIEVVTQLSDELNLEFDLSRCLVFNGSPTKGPGVKRVVFTPVIPANNVSTHGRITVRALRANDSSKCDANVEAQPFTGATVTATDKSGQRAPTITTTDENGEAVLILLPGTYDVVIGAAEEPGGGTGDVIPVIPVTYEDQEVYLANETRLQNAVLETSFTSTAYDQDTAILLSIMMNVAYADGRGGYSGGLAGQEPGQALVRPNSGYANGLDTEFAEYLDPCWEFVAYNPKVTQFFVARNADNGDIVVGFAGTADFLDALFDIDALKAPWTLRGADGSSRNGEIEQSVHEGVKIAYLAVANLLEATLRELIRKSPSGSRPKVYFTGHSLGGMLATLAALDLSDYLVKQHGYERNNIIMYGYAGPRVMTENMLPIFRAKVPNGHSIIAKDDIAGHVLGDDEGLGDNYAHITNLVILSTNIHNSEDDGDERYKGLGATRIEHSNGLSYKGCFVLGAPSAGYSLFAYGKKGHDQLQYIKRLENLHENGIPAVDLQSRPFGLGDRLWLTWSGGVNGPCDWVGLYATPAPDGGDPPSRPTDADSYIKLVGGWQWAVRGDGYPGGASEKRTRKNPNGLIDNNKDFWMGYVDGFNRIIRTDRYTGHQKAGEGSLAAFDANELRLSSPHPNPAISGTDLRYVLPAAGAVHLAVYDVAGRLVREVAAGAQEAGFHIERWDLRDGVGRSVTQGIYFVRLDTESGVLLQKVVVTR